MHQGIIHRVLSFFETWDKSLGFFLVAGHPPTPLLLRNQFPVLTNQRWRVVMNP